MIEVDAFDLCIGREHFERSALGLDDRGIVARSDNNPVRRRQPRRDALNEGALAEVGNGASRQLRRGNSAPLCRVGRSNEPAKAGGAAVVGRVSGFLTTEACTHATSRLAWVMTLAQTSLRKPSRAKQELSGSWPACRGLVKASKLLIKRRLLAELRNCVNLHAAVAHLERNAGVVQDLVHQLLESQGSFVEFPM